MGSRVECWSIEKALAWLKRLIHKDVLPSISQEELDQFEYKKIFEGTERVLEFLRFVYAKSDYKLEAYGTADDMIRRFKYFDRIPEFVTFTSTPKLEVSFNCAKLTTLSEYRNKIGGHIYLSRRDSAIYAFRWIEFNVNKFKLEELTVDIFSAWFILHLNHILYKLKGSYDFPPLDSFSSFNKKLGAFAKVQPNIKVPEEPVTFESFSNLRTYFDPEEIEVLDNILEFLKNDIMDDSKQEHYKKIYAQVVFLFENIKKIYDQHPDLFNPSLQPEITPSIQDKPIIRFFRDAPFGYYLSKEIENAVQKLMIKNKSKNETWKDMIVVESEEERKNGIVYVIQPSEYEKLLKTIGCNDDSFVIFEDSLPTDTRYMALPIISTYGTHCISALDAFDHIVYYLTITLKVFQRCKYDDLQEVWLWIHYLMESTFIEKPVFYLIEFRKIEEIFDKARKDLIHLLTKPEYEVPLDPENLGDNIERVCKNMLPHTVYEHHGFFRTVCIDVMRGWCTPNINVRNVCIGLSQVMRAYLEKYCPKVGSFISNQTSLKEKNTRKRRPM